MFDDFKAFSTGVKNLSVNALDQTFVKGNPQYIAGFSETVTTDSFCKYDLIKTPFPDRFLLTYCF